MSIGAHSMLLQFFLQTLREDQSHCLYWGDGHRDQAQDWMASLRENVYIQVGLCSFLHDSYDPEMTGWEFYRLCHLQYVSSLLFCFQFSGSLRDQPAPSLAKLRPFLKKKNLQTYCMYSRCQATLWELNFNLIFRHTICKIKLHVC